MDSFSIVLTRIHRDCDEQFVAAENALAANNRDEALRHFTDFRRIIEHHLQTEEEVLFPAFEQRTGSSMGPTQVMRMEHIQIRELIAAMASSLEGRNKQEYLGQSDTLMVLMQQHNIKEENVLYPMTDQVLAGEREQLLPRMLATETGAGNRGGV